MKRVDLKKSRIPSGDAHLAVTEFGQGQRLIFVNGLGAPQQAWRAVIRRLAGNYRIITFDFRGHGMSSTSSDYSFQGSLEDMDAVMRTCGGDQPVVVAWSLGADVALRYAATHPDKIKGVLVVDGALPAHLIEGEDELRQILNKPVARLQAFLLRLLRIGSQLSPAELATVNLDLDKQRAGVLDVYARLDCPIELVLAAKTAGAKGAYAEHINKLWHEAAQRVANAFPGIPIHWLDSRHQLPITKPVDLARFIDEFCGRLYASTDLRTAH